MFCAENAVGAAGSEERLGDASTRIRARIDSKGKSYESRRVREKQLMQQMMWRTLIWNVQRQETRLRRGPDDSVLKHGPYDLYSTGLDRLEFLGRN